MLIYLKPPTVVPLYTAPLTSSHPSYTARFIWHGQFSLFNLPLTSGNPSDTASGHPFGV